MDDDDVANGATLVPPTLQLSAADRLRVFREDDAALAELAEVVHRRAMAGNESANPAGHLDLKIRERRAAMWGHDSPVRFDMIQVGAQQAPTEYQQIRAAVLALADSEQPVRRAAIRRLDQIGPERTLELLGPFEGDTDGTEPWPDEAALRRPEPK